MKNNKVVKAYEGRRVVLTPTRMYYMYAEPDYEYVTRLRLGRALRGLRNGDDEVGVVIHNACEGFRGYRYCDLSRGCLTFGCCAFSKKATAIIQRWALAKQRSER